MNRNASQRFKKREKKVVTKAERNKAKKSTRAMTTMAMREGVESSDLKNLPTIEKMEGRESKK